MRVSMYVYDVKNCIPRSTLAERLRCRGRSWVFDLNKSDLCPSLVKGLTAKGLGPSRGGFPYCDNAPRQIAWTTEEEIALAKGWVAISENIEHGNARKKNGFWCEVLAYIESKTKAYGCRTYDMVCEKWKTVRPTVIRFCGVHDNVMRMAKDSGAGDKDYLQRAMIHYQAETRLPFKFRQCWDVLKDS
ncbi:hypothetical protein Tco_1076759, partial [Tanacetum coccineum]